MTWKDWTDEQWVAIDYVVGAYTENLEEEVGYDVSDDDDEVPEGLAARMMDVFDYDQLRAFAFDLHEASYNHDHEAFAERMEGNGPGFIEDSAWVFLNPPIEDIEFLGPNCQILRDALNVAGITVQSEGEP